MTGNSVCTCVFLATTSQQKRWTLSHRCENRSPEETRESDEVVQNSTAHQHSSATPESSWDRAFILFFLFKVFILLFVLERKNGGGGTEESLKWFIQYVYASKLMTCWKTDSFRKLSNNQSTKDMKRTKCPSADFSSFTVLLCRAKKKCKYLDLQLWNLVYTELLLSWYRHWYQYQIPAFLQVLAQNTLVQIPGSTHCSKF